MNNKVMIKKCRGICERAPTFVNKYIVYWQ